VSVHEPSTESGSVTMRPLTHARPCMTFSNFGTQWVLMTDRDTDVLRRLAARMAERTFDAAFFDDTLADVLSVVETQ